MNKNFIQIADSDLSYSCDADDTVLRAALRAGLGFSYECNVGSCGSCRFELVSGEVEMAWPQAPAWTDRDRQHNKYLGCQARARSACVIKPKLTDKYRPPHPPQRTHATFVASRPITADISEFRFELHAAMHFEPGQYALLYVPGIEGARAYSMSNLPGDGNCIELQVRRTPEGRGSAALFQLAIGTGLEIDGPYGMAWLRTAVKRDILCVAGGSGLAPMISIARGAMATPALENVQLHFIYGGRTPQDICGEDMLHALPGWGERLHYLPVVSGDAAEAEWSGATGFVHEVAHQMFASQLPDMEIYFAGPPAMTMAVLRMLMKAKVPLGQIHFDQFY